MAIVKVIPSKINPLTRLPHGSLHKRRVAAYARVSTEQEEQANSYEAQVDYYTNFINSHPEWEKVNIYTDKGISGTNLKHRDGFNKMIEDARAGLIDLIITKSVSRFARNTLDTISLTRELKSKGVEIFFEEQNVYTFDSNGELMLTILASMAQEESRNISENVKWGKKKKAKDGYVQLGYSRFMGYDKHQDPKIALKVNEEQAEVIRFIYSEFLKGKGYNLICRELETKNIKTPSGKDKWQVSTIKSILSNEKYKGDAEMQKTFIPNFLDHMPVKNNGEQEKIYIEDHHEPIINKEHWQLVQKEIRRREGDSGYSSNNEFCCKIICGECGGFYGKKIWHSTDKYRKEVYQCCRKFRNKNKTTICKTPTFTAEEIKNRFVIAYNKFIEDKTAVVDDCKEMMMILDDSKSIEEEINNLTMRANDIVVLVENLVERNSTEPIDQTEFQRRYNELDEEHSFIIKRIEELSSEIESKKAQAICLESFIKDLDNMPGVINEFDDNLWSMLIDKAIVNKDGTIKFIFMNGREIID